MAKAAPLVHTVNMPSQTFSRRNVLPRNRLRIARIALAAGIAVVAMMAGAALAQQKPYSNDMNENFKIPPLNRDYTRREVMIPMRDGVKLFTVIWIPKGAHDAPMLLTRTCYD